MRTSIAVALVVAGCGGAPSVSKPAAPAAAAAPGASGCLADGRGTLRVTDQFRTSCLAAGQSCARSCAAGDADACMVEAYARQRAEDDIGASRGFHHACKLGLAVGCTNYGAELWLGHQPAPEADVACARRLFQRACEVREEFGCGMVGRMLAGGAKTPEQQQAARAWFDKTCSDLGGMSCRMYAHHLETGDLGPAEPATIRALMLRACDTGDKDACGHDAASETFHE